MQLMRQGRFERRLEKELKRPKLTVKNKPSDEYGAQIINAMEGNIPFRFNGNIMNREKSLITNLPMDCCVEVPIFADKHGFHPQGGISLPTVCQALCISNVMVQKAAVEGALECNKEKIHQAILLDPNSASVCSTTEINELVEEMFEAQAKWSPQF
ncbi:MAG: hypothetical protein GF311_15635 [Candidatus Lokiarchaeota archaeon]|nr:hypothetical protein [Candidatus Lokiarchaeota archaeon]